LLKHSLRGVPMMRLIAGLAVIVLSRVDEGKALHRNHYCLFSPSATVVAITLLLIGCGGGGDHNPPPAQLQSISVSPANPTIALGLTQQLRATGTFSNGNTRDLSG